MMNSVRLVLNNFIKYLFYIAVFAQIVSGTVYLVCNFTEYIVYPETEEMIHVARGLLFDEYTGILYPLFVRMCLGIQGTLGVGYYLVAHLVQLVLFVWASAYLAGSMFKGKKTFIAMLYIVSFPICMQTILMVSPMAFKAIFALLIVGAMIRITKGNGKIDTWICLFVAYILAAINMPDDLYMWLVPIAIWGIVYFFRERKQCALWKRVCLILTIGAVFLGTFVVLDSAIDAGNRGRMQRTVQSALFQRTVWPNLDEKYGFLPEEMRNIIGDDFLIGSEFSSENIVYEVGPAIDRAAGLEHANELYMEAVIGQLGYNKRALAKAVSNDFVGYLLMPYSTVFYMMGQGGSSYSTLYGSVNLHNSSAVYGYFCVSFVALFLLTFYGILRIIQKRCLVQKQFKMQVSFCILILLYQALWYAIANVQGVDYRYGLLNVAIFSIFALDSEWIKEDAIKINKKIFSIIGVGVLILAIVGIIGLAMGKSYKASNELSGKSIVCLGDSIWGLCQDETGIASIVEKMTGATVFNWAIPGSTASKTDDLSSEKSLMEIVEGLKENKEEAKVISNADYLIIAYGLNDYFKGIPAEGEESYKSYLSDAVEFFKEQYPDLQIVLIGQTYCQFYSYGIVEDDSDTKNFGGGNGTDYVEATQNVAKEKEVLFVNMYDELPMDEWNGKLYLEDATHLNENGRRKYAKVVSEYILEDYKERNAK